MSAAHNSAATVTAGPGLRRSDSARCDVVYDRHHATPGKRTAGIGVIINSSRAVAELGINGHAGAVSVIGHRASANDGRSPAKEAIPPAVAGKPALWPDIKFLGVLCVSDRLTTGQWQDYDQSQRSDNGRKYFPHAVSP